MEVEYEVLPVVKEYFSIFHVIETTWEEDESSAYALNCTTDIVSTWDDRQDAEREALKCNMIARGEGLRN